MFYKGDLEAYSTYHNSDNIVKSTDSLKVKNVKQMFDTEAQRNQKYHLNHIEN